MAVQLLLLLGLFTGAAATCAQDMDAGSCAADGEESSSLLQMESHQPSQRCWSWRTPSGNSNARTCNEVCKEYGSTCVREGFSEAGSVSSVDAAHQMATGRPCGRRYSSPSQVNQAFAPYVDIGSWDACYFPAGNSQSTCGSVPDARMYSRICPCSAYQVQRPVTTPPPQTQCAKLSGTFCAGKDLQCNCNYCDDFKQNTRCSNACRVMNGYRSSPFANINWQAQRTSQPANVQGCDCSWMARNGGLGDDCKQCDSCAYECRKRNAFPQGTCR